MFLPQIWPYQKRKNDRSERFWTHCSEFNCVKSEVWSIVSLKIQLNVNVSEQFEQFWEKNTIFVLRIELLLLRRLLFWLPWYFWENMWLWCSSRLFPPIYRPCGKKWGIFLHLDILSNSWLLWMSNIFHNFKFWLRARKICGLSNFFWEIWPISGSH